VKLLISLLIPGVLFSQSENDFLSEINSVRTNPAAYSKVLEKRIENWRGFMSDEWIREARSTAAFLRKASAVPPLQPDTLLRKSLEKHKGIDTLEMQVRHDIQCNPYDFKAENITSGNDVSRAIALLLVDHGYPNKDHLKHIMDPRYTLSAVKKVTFGSGKYTSRTCWIQQFGKNEQ
jgi:hypothetical protein